MTEIGPSWSWHCETTTRQDAYRKQHGMIYTCFSISPVCPVTSLVVAPMRFRLTCRPIFLLMFTALALSLGCGESPTVPIQGQVVWEDGTPAGDLEGYAVEAEIKGGKHVARGPIGPEGRFVLSTFNEHDGAEPGEYMVLVAPIPRGEHEPPVPVALPERFQSFETSGLSFTVRRGKPNEVVLKVSRE